jgi:WD40 repeat protein
MVGTNKRHRESDAEVTSSTRTCSSVLAARWVYAAVFVFVSLSRLYAQTDLINPTIRNAFNAGKPVDTLALSPDGKWGAVGMRGGQVGIFSLGSPGTPRWVAQHKNRVNAIVFDRAGSFLGAAGEDNVVTLANIPGGGVKELHGHRHQVLTLAFSPSGKLLASAGEDREVIVWDPASGTELYRLDREGRKALIFVGFNSSETTLLAVDESGIISEWDVKNRARLRQLQDSEKTVDSAAINFSGTLLAVGSEFTAMQKGAGVPIGERPSARDALRSGIGPGGDILTPSSTIRPTELYRESRIKLYDLEKLAVAKTLDGINGRALSISVSPDNRYVAVARQRISESFLSIYDVLRASEVVSFPASGNVRAVVFSADGRLLASGADTGEVRIFAMSGVLPRGELGDLIGMKFSITSSQGGSLISPDSNLAIAVADFEAHGVDEGTAQAASELLRTRIGANGRIRLVDMKRMKEILHQQNFEYSNRVDPKTALQMGHIINAQKMVYGSVSKLGTSMTIHAEMIDVETARTDGSCEVLCQQCSAEDLPEAVAKLKPALIADSR